MKITQFFDSSTHLPIGKPILKKLVIVGGSGFLGKALADYFGKKVEIVVLSRQNLASFNSNHLIRYVHWDGKTLGDWAKELDGADAVINLAGRSVNCRYNAKNRQEILDSRIKATIAIGLAICQATRPPKNWINSSTATIYRHAEDRDMDEYTGEIQNDFSVQVAKKWEEVFYNAPTPPDVRKIAIRSAIVLGRHDGVMTRLLNLVRFGLGGKQGSGSQFVSWIHETDFCRSIAFLIDNEALTGTFNLASPNPVTNEYLMRSLRKTLRMPFGLPATTWMLRIGSWLIGTETELILKSRRVVPTRLLESGFTFQFADILSALNDLISHKKTVSKPLPTAEISI